MTRERGWIFAKVGVDLLNQDRAHGAGAAMATWTWALLWTRHQERDGFVSRRAIGGAWVGERQGVKDMARLVAEGLAVEAEGGWRLLNYERFNETKSEIEARKSEEREKKRGQRSSSFGGQPQNLSGFMVSVPGDNFGSPPVVSPSETETETETESLLSRSRNVDSRSQTNVVCGELPPSEQAAIAGRKTADVSLFGYELGERAENGNADSLSEATDRTGDREAPATLAASEPQTFVLGHPGEKRTLSPKDRVFAHWSDATFARNGSKGKRPIFDRKRKAKVEARLKENYSVEDLCSAIDGCFATPFNCGDNASGKAYLDLELICRDASHVDGFMSSASKPAAMGQQKPSAPSSPTRIDDRHPERKEIEDQVFLAWLCDGDNGNRPEVWKEAWKELEKPTLTGHRCSAPDPTELANARADLADIEAASVGLGSVKKLREVIARQAKRKEIYIPTDEERASFLADLRALGAQPYHFEPLEPEPVGPTEKRKPSEAEIAAYEAKRAKALAKADAEWKLEDPEEFAEWERSQSEEPPSQKAS